MNELPAGLRQLWQRFAGSAVLDWFLLLIVVLVLFRIGRWLLAALRRRDPARSDPSSLELDVARLWAPMPDARPAAVRVRHIPVRVAVSIIAPLGRGT